MLHSCRAAGDTLRAVCVAWAVVSRGGAASTPLHVFMGLVLDGSAGVEELSLALPVG